MNKTQMAQRVAELLNSDTVVSRNFLEQCDWYGFVLDDSHFRTYEAHTLIKAFASIDASKLYWCVTNDLLKSPDTTTIHSLPFDISMLESSLFDMRNSVVFYDRIIFDENVSAVVLLPVSLHIFYAGPKQFIETISCSPWAEGKQRIRFFGNVFDDPGLKNHYKEELANQEPESPNETFSEATVSNSAVQELHNLIEDDRMSLVYIRSRDWSLGIADFYMGLARVAIATAFMNVGARRIMLTRTDQLNDAVSMELSATDIREGVCIGVWLQQHVAPPRGGTIHRCLVYADNLAACILVVDDDTLVFAGPATFVEHATSLDLSQTTGGIAKELKTSGILGQVLSDYPGVP